MAASTLIRVPRSRLFLGIRICIDGKRVSSNSGHFRDGDWLGVRLFFLSALLVRLPKSLTYKLMPVWAELARHFQERQCMDMVFTAGQYTQVSMLLNSFGVQLDEGQVLDPDLRGF